MCVGGCLCVSPCLSLGKPVRHVVPKCQPPTKFLRTSCKMRKIEAICELCLVRLNEVSFEDYSLL